FRTCGATPLAATTIVGQRLKKWCSVFVRGSRAVAGARLPLLRDGARHPKAARTRPTVLAELPDRSEVEVVVDVFGCDEDAVDGDFLFFGQLPGGQEGVRLLDGQRAELS